MHSHNKLLVPLMIAVAQLVTMYLQPSSFKLHAELVCIAKTDLEAVATPPIMAEILEQLNKAAAKAPAKRNGAPKYKGGSELVPLMARM
eukprot:756442-Amphidinium_carterae.1